MTSKEIAALKTLHNNKEIVIKKGDKGAGIVILDKNDYESKINIMLSDVNTYTNLTTDTTQTIKQNTDLLITTLLNQEYINSKQLKNLTDYTAKCPLFYGVPKVHKQGCPLRPIVSQMKGPTRKLNDLLDTYLKVAEEQIPYLLQDTTAFINLLNNKQNQLTPNSLLVTLDVVSLYTNIPHQEGTEFVAEYYEETLPMWPKNQLKPVNKETLKTLLLFVLQNTILQFNKKYYKQNYGCSMGAQSSVKFANIYMHKLLTKFKQAYKQYLPEFFGRLVDDIFTIWNDDLKSLQNFVKMLNEFHPTIKFELKYSQTDIQFLDTIVYIENNTLKTKLYTKPTDKKQYLHYTSSHPQHIKTAIPYSQALRYRRICSDHNILKSELNNLQQKFINRHYPKKQTSKHVLKALDLSRSKTLIYKTKQQKQQEFKNFLKGDTFLPLIITYHPTLHINKQNNIKQLFNKEWEIFLQQHVDLQTIFKSSKPQIVYKKHKTLSAYLTSAAYPPSWQQDKTTHDDSNIHILTELLQQNNIINIAPCDHALCKCCTHIKDLSHLTIFNNITLTYNQQLTCNTTNTIYLIHCQKCKLNYIGETKRSLKERLTNHRSTIKTHKQTAIGIHFNMPQHNIKDLKIMPLNHSPDWTDYDRKQQEGTWIKILKTSYPTGLNNYPIITNNTIE